MSTTDQAFFAAYGPTVTSVSGPPQPARSRRPAPVAADRQRTGSAVESQNPDGAWCRVDPRHQDQDGPPPPHLAKVPGKQPISPVDSISLEFGSWSTADEWQSSSVVISAAMPSITPTDETSIGEMVAKAESSESIEPQAVAERADETVAREEPAVDEPSEAPRVPWKAQWEVDGFSWPEELLRLQTEQTDYFRYAGEKLRDASREGLKTLAVVSTREQEGCTTMAICLALAAAAAGARVALLDANLSHPELGPKLGLDFSNGWQESVTGESLLAEAAVTALDTSLTLLPLSAAHRLPALSDSRISRTLGEIAAAFDLLVIDAGVASIKDGALFAAGAECPVNAALVVRDLRRTSEAETLATAARLKSLGIDAIGIAENFLPPPNSQVAAA